MKQTDYKKEVQVMLSPDVNLNGILSIPDDATGIILFAHGSGSSRHSPRNQYVAETLNEAGFATLLFDLLTEVEEAIDNRTRSYRFDISLLAKRVMGVIDWLREQAVTKELSIGLFGTSTGAVAALVAASKRQTLVDAIVSRGGRPDLASDGLSQVQAPTLLIVGGKDKKVIDYNQEAMSQLNTIKELEIVPEASHLFEEPGKLQVVAKLAQDWFAEHIVSSTGVQEKT